MKINLGFYITWLILHARSIATEEITASDIQNVAILIDNFGRAHAHLKDELLSKKIRDGSSGISVEVKDKLAGSPTGEGKKKRLWPGEEATEETDQRKRTSEKEEERIRQEERIREEQRLREIEEEQKKQEKIKEEQERAERKKQEKIKEEQERAERKKQEKIKEEQERAERKKIKKEQDREERSRLEKKEDTKNDEEIKPTLEEEAPPQKVGMPRAGREKSKRTRDAKDKHARDKLKIPACNPLGSKVLIEELGEERLRLISPYQGGIGNSGNTCFMNAALQGLFNWKEFSQGLLLLPKAPKEYSTADATVTSALQAVFTRMALASLQKGGSISIAPDLFKLFGGLGFVKGGQDDVSAALDALLARMPSHLEELYLMGDGESSKHATSRVTVQYFKNYVNAHCSIEDVEGCLHEGGLTFLAEQPPKVISLRLPRIKTNERIKRLFPEFINLKAFDINLTHDVFYRFRWAALYRGEYHYTSYVYNEASNCYFHCDDDSCTRLQDFAQLRDACRPTHEIVNLEYIRVDPDEGADSDIILPKKLVYEALNLHGGFRGNTLNAIKSALGSLMDGYKPKEEKLPDLEDLTLKVFPSTCKPTLLPERSDFQDTFLLIPQKYFVIDSWPELSLSCLLLYNYPSLRVMVLSGEDPSTGTIYAEWEKIVKNVFNQLLAGEAFDTGQSSVSLAKDVTNDQECLEKLAQTLDSPVSKVFMRLAANLRKNLVTDSILMEYMANGEKKESRYLELDCTRSANILECLQKNGISFLRPPKHLTVILKGDTKGLALPEIIQPQRSIYQGAMAVAYELHSILMQDSRALLKNHSSGCWHECTKDLCRPITSLPTTEEARKEVKLIMYSLAYPPEQAVVDEMMSEFVA